MNVIFLISQPFNSYFDNRVQLTRLAEEGFSVKVFDLSSFMMSNAQKTSYSTNDKRIDILNIKDRKSFLEIIKKYRRNTVIVDYSNQDPLIRHVINKLNIKIIRIQGSGAPSVYLKNSNIENIKKTNLFPNFWIRLDYIKKSSPTYIFNSLKKKFFLRIFKPFIDVFILSGDEMLTNEQRYINSDTKIIKAHDFDFDKFKSIKSNLGQPKEHLIFIDQMIPNHPEFTLRNNRYPSPKIYYERLNYFFDKVEEATNLNVIISLHPRNTTNIDSLGYGNREVIYGDTADLIKNSRGIITHNSTSITFAILFKKPILFIADKELIHMIPAIQVLHNRLSQKTIMIDRAINNSDIISNMQINKKIRAEFKKNFIICNYSNENMTLIDILIVELRNLFSLQSNK